MDTQIQVIEKSYRQADGSEIVAHMIRLGEQDYLTAGEAAEAFGVEPATIRQLVIKHGLNRVDAIDAVVQDLKAQGVIGLRTSTVNLLPRDTIDALVRIINTDEAKAAYRQIIGEWREAKRAEATALDHLAASVKMMSKVISDAAELSMEVNKRVDVVADAVTQVQTQITERATRDAEDTLTSHQAESLVIAMRQRAYKVRSQTYYLSLPQLINMMKSCVKNYFFEPGVAGAMQWKDIRQGDLAHATALLETWDPAQNWRWAQKQGESYRKRR